MAIKSGMEIAIETVLKFIGIDPVKARADVARVQQTMLDAANHLDCIDARLQRIERKLGIDEHDGRRDEIGSGGNDGKAQAVG